MAEQFDRGKFVTALDAARKKKGLSLERLAVQVGLSSATLRNYRAGRSVPGADDLYRIAEALEMDPVELFQPGLNHDEPQPERRKPLPLYGRIPAGPPSAVEQAGEEYYVLEDLAKPNRYVLRIEGESMSPVLRDRDLVLMEYVPKSDIFQFHKRVCAVLLEGESMIKRVEAERSKGYVIVSLKGGDERVHATFVLGARKFSIQGVALELVSRKLD